MRYLWAPYSHSFLMQHITSYHLHTKRKASIHQPLLWETYGQVFSIVFPWNVRIPHYFHTEERQVKYPLVWNTYGHPIPIVFHTKLSLHEHKNLYSFHYSFHILHFTKLDTISVPYHGLARYGLLFTMSNPYFYFVRESIFYPSILVYVFFCDLYQLFLFGLCFTLVFYF